MHTDRDPRHGTRRHSNPFGRLAAALASLVGVVALFVLFGIVLVVVLLVAIL